jgi:hypothetical protein
VPFDSALWGQNDKLPSRLNPGFWVDEKKKPLFVGNLVSFWTRFRLLKGNIGSGAGVAG